MSKASREIALLRAAVTKAMAESMAVELVEFTQIDGDKVQINPDAVESVEPRGSGARIRMNSRAVHNVTESQVDVLAALE